jgi:hypothetical protein
MSNLLYPTPPVKRPVAVYYFYHKVQTWMKQPADQATLSWLRQYCDQLHHDDLPAGFDQHYRQRLTFIMPQPEVLHWLAKRDGVLVNMVEFAIDFIYENWRDRDNANDYLHRHLIRLWHGRRQFIKLSKRSRRAPHSKDADGGKLPGTRYDAGPTAPNRTAIYRRRYSQVTGETDVLHLEWRASNLRAVQRAGIRCAADLLKNNHRQFWKRRFILVDIDPERLGRIIRNRAAGTRSRNTLHSDRRTGRVWLNTKPTIQAIIDVLHRRRIRFAPALIRLPTNNWMR